MPTDRTAPGDSRDGELSVEDTEALPTGVPARGKRQGIGHEPTQLASGPSAPDELERSTENDLPSRKAPTAREAPIRAGATLGGRYQIVRLIARGSMSRIYRAEQSSIHRTVALKIIGHEFARDAQAVARFRQEAAVLANVDHPNIVTVYDIGSTAGGEPYIVMEFVDGASLADVIRDQGRMTPARTVGLLLQIARALASVHGKGVIHRDMKPSNVLLASRTPGVEIAKLVDFGLAKVIQDRSDGKFLTRTGTILGTPEYMSPEQIRGAAVDHRADIYSLGCMAYEMLTGTPPFVGEEMSTLYRHLHEKPRPMRDACPDAGIPAQLEPLVERAMAKDAADRFPDCATFYRELLAVSDRIGIPRGQLHLLETMFDSDEGLEVDGPAAAPRPAGRSSSAQPAAASPRRRRLELALLLITTGVAALLAGVMIERNRPREEAAPPAPVAEAAPVGPELLMIATTPEGAGVEVDGTMLAEATPTAVHGIAPGPHTLVLHKPGYGRVERRIEVPAGGRLALDVRLPPPTRTVVVRTVPSDAMVFLDNRLVSPSTPATLVIEQEDFHELRVERDGFEPLIKHLTPDDQENELQLTLDLEKRPIGTVWVESNEAAQVWIDGMDTGFVTPTFGIRVKAGRHTVELRDSAGRHSRPVRLEIVAGKSERLVMDLEPPR